MGLQDMFLLGGLIGSGEQTALLPGALHRNRDEMRLLQYHIKNTQRLIATETIVHEMMAMEPEGEDTDGEQWSKDEWYCMECIKQLFRNRFMLWWREAKRQGEHHMAYAPVLVLRWTHHRLISVLQAVRPLKMTAGTSL